MDIDQLLEVMEYSFLNHYKNKARFGLLQYFSLTDIAPRQLSKIAASKKKRTLSRLLGQFSDQNIWRLKELELEKSISLLHSIHGHVVTQQEKLDVVEKLKEETFPVLEGTLMEGSRYYVCDGIDAISKEQIQSELLECYHTYCDENQSSNKPYVLMKQRERK